MTAIAVMGAFTFPNSAALEPFRRVKNDGGVLAYASDSETELGVLNERVFATDGVGSVVPFEDSNPRWMIAAGSFVQFATLYAAASGKVDDSGTYVRGIALTASGGDGDRVIVLPLRSASSGLVARAGLVEDALAPFGIPLTNLRVWNAIGSILPSSASSDDLGLINGTFSSDPASVQASDFGGTSVLQYARFLFTLPPEYVAGGDIKIRAKAGMLTSIADAPCTLDVECHKDGAGSDLCATAAQSINDLTKANKDFTITPTGLVAGDVLDVRLAIAGSDTANAAVMIPEIDFVQVLLDIKG